MAINHIDDNKNIIIFVTGGEDIIGFGAVYLSEDSDNAVSEMVIFHMIGHVFDVILMNHISQDDILSLILKKSRIKI